MSNIDQTLKERGSRYNLNGEYKDHARLTQQMKEACRQHKGWKTCPPNMQEAIDMILHKIARVLNGDPYYIDNWVDIEGYSRLVSRKLDPKGDSSLETTGTGTNSVGVVSTLNEPLPIASLTDNDTNVMWPDYDDSRAGLATVTVSRPPPGYVIGWIRDS